MLAAHYVPSVVVLGQWTSLRALPLRMCRWQGPDRPAVALTFDDGPHPESTPRVLDALERQGLRATFFCLASEAERYPEIAAEIDQRGHQVETHGYHHEHHLLRSPRWIWHDLRRARDTMEFLGFRPRWYRPTYGQATGSSLAIARALGLEPVLWSAWGREWTTDDSAEVATRVARRLRPGAIVLLHDTDSHGASGMWRVAMDALPQLAQELQRRGLSSVTLDRMLVTC